MRAIPTITISGLRLWDLGAGPAVTSLAGTWSTTEQMSQCFNASGGGLTTGRPCVVNSNGNAADYIAADSEL